MAEALQSFVARRRPDWEALGALLGRYRRRELGLSDLREVDRLYRKASADLARAQSFYPDTDAHRYLNQLCGQAYGVIYQPPRDRWRRVREFYRSEFPAAVRAERAFVLASALLFALGIAIGAAVVLLDPNGADLLVPAPMRATIAEHRMWTDDILSVMPANAVASTIATNNLTVTIAAFALGLPLGLGTLFLLLNNGVHLGSVAALCLREGMGYPLFSFIGGHGPVELSVIVVAGGAGLILGHALLDPGELARGERLRQRSREAIKLIVGCAPFLALIALIEGFVSPGDLFPGWSKIALGLGLGGLFWGYLWGAGRDRAPSSGASRAPR